MRRYTAIIVVLLLALAGVSVHRLPARAEVTEKPIASLAVLPLESLSQDPEQEYFADGMTEALIADLAQIRALRVIARTSVMQYKGARKPLPEIAQKLKVDIVVEGSVQRAGDRMRVTVQLIHAATDRPLWAKSYERDLGDILALQSEVAQAIAQEVKVKLTPQERTRMASARPVNRQAYDAYLKGCYLWNRGTEAAIKKSIGYYEQAIEEDPSYALAYAGLSDAYLRLDAHGTLPAVMEKYIRADKSMEDAVSTLEVGQSLARRCLRPLADRRDACPTFTLTLKGRKGGTGVPPVSSMLWVAFFSSISYLQEWRNKT